jgi:hypothetical protein
MVDLTIPLKVICIVPKREITDNAFSDDIVANKVCAVLNSVNSFLNNVDSSNLIVEDYETDNQTILSEEFTGINQTDIHYKYAFVSISLIAKVVVDSTCLEEPCHGVPSCYSSTPLFVRCADTSHIDQTSGGGSYGVLTGAVDGVNTTYTVSEGEYTSGKLTVYINGKLLIQVTDWSQLSPAAGTFTVVTAPFTGDILTAIYQ